MAKRNREEASDPGQGSADVDDDWISGHLRRVRDDILREEIPERMRNLADQLDRLDEPEEEDPP